MNLKTIIKNNGSKNDSISIDKFFQFIIVKDLDKNQREITIYNAVVMNAETNKPDITLSYKYNYEDAKIKYNDTNDCHSFFQNEDILKQFWGGNSIFTNNTVEKLNEITKCTTPQSVHNYLNSNNPCSGCFYIEQDEKDNIEKSLIKPLKIKTNANGVVLNDCETKLILPEPYRKLILNGFWFKNIITVNIDRNEKNLELDFCIDLLGAKYSSPDFKVYLLTDEKYSLKNTRASISYSNTNIDLSNCEVIKVYSQNKMIYFEEWVKLGIKSNSLLRVKMNTASESKIFSIGLKKIRSYNKV
ncbi:Uncharacterised protein [Providencia rustigianii]|nr:Uncharacterised protein [Providencia rustigianii]